MVINSVIDAKLKNRKPEIYGGSMKVTNEAKSK
jgi:hypothetical protein